MLEDLDTTFKILAVAAGILLWILPTLVRWALRTAGSRRALPVPEEPPEVVLEEIQPPGQDDFGWILEELSDLLDRAQEIAAEAEDLKAACAQPGLSAFIEIIDEAVAVPASSIAGRIRRAMSSPDDQDTAALIGEIGLGIEVIRAGERLLERLVLEHGSPPDSTIAARSLAVGRAFLDRLEGALQRTGRAPYAPLLVPIGTREVDSLALLALAPTRAVPFGSVGAGPTAPPAWASVARDLARWVLLRSPELSAEISGRTTATLASLGYRPVAPHPGLVEETFSTVVSALLLGRLLPSAIEAGLVAGSAPLARRSLDLTHEDAASSDLRLPVLEEILVHVIVRTPLDALGGTRLIDDPALVFSRSDEARAAVVAGSVAAGETPDADRFHLVVGVMRACLDRPESEARALGVLDRALGTRAHRAPAGSAGPGSMAEQQEDGFLTTRGLVQSIVLGTLLARRRF